MMAIDSSNVQTLGLAWEFDDFNVRGRTHRGVEATQYVAVLAGFGGAVNAIGYPNLGNLPQGTHDAIQGIVLGGAFSYAGMPSFRDVLSPDDVKAIQACIIADETATRK